MGPGVSAALGRLQPAPTLATRLLLPLAFVGGLTSLGIEFAASRLLAPFFGQSLFIWGTLIGLILIYLTVGYYAGGRLADRYPHPRLLYTVTAAAALTTAMIPVISRPILSLSQTGFAQLSVGLVLGSLISVVVLFAVPVVLLGMVSPFVIRLRIQHLATAGNAAGAVYALSTLGSILGTFLPVFWLIPTFGTRPTIIVLALLLGLISAAGLWAAGARRIAALLPVLIVVLGVLSGGSIRSAAYGQRIYEAESAYNYIQVVRNGTENDLILNEGQAVHSIYDPTTIYTHGYWDDVLLAPYFGTGHEPIRIALVGLAGGTVARQFTAIDGAIPIDGVELDPRIVDVGRRFFAMTEPNLNVTVADGRYWMATQHQKYDVILVDAYRQPYIPFYLTTREFFADARAHLNPGGVLAINVGRTATDYRLVDALGGTLTAVFPRVFALDTGHGFANSLLFATAAPTTIDDFRGRAAAQMNPRLKPIVDEALASGNVRAMAPNGIVFTDELAPVERLIDDIILGYIRKGG
ncbi:MAG: fused MFS/spermidine synthase [Candidatus Dormibacteraeota bacterium]|nr:fused MFS/spermidine synthase [Candidatus Dormibacteraeota bacterium]